MNKEELRRRTKAFALRVLKLIRALPKEIGELTAIFAAAIKTGRDAN